MLKLCTILLTLALSACGGLKQQLNGEFLRPRADLIGTPEHLGLVYEDTSVGSDATRRYGWFVHALGVSNPSEAQGTVILCHGNFGNISYFGPYIDFLARGGYNVLTWNHAGFGPSPGQPDLATHFHDLPMQLEWLKQRIGEDSQAYQQLAIFGVSLGSMVALRGARDFPHIRACIVEDVVSPADNLRDWLMQEQGLNPVASRFGVAALQMAVVPDAIEPDHNAAHVTVPMLVIGGATDRLFDQRAAVRSVTIADKAAFWVVPESGHSPGKMQDYDGEFQHTVLSFLADSLAGAAPLHAEYTRISDTLHVTLRGGRPFTDGERRPIELCVIRKGKLIYAFRVWQTQMDQRFELPLSSGIKLDAVSANVYLHYAAVEDPELVAAGKTWQRVETTLARATRQHREIRDAWAAMQSEIYGIRMRAAGQTQDAAADTGAGDNAQVAGPSTFHVDAESCRPFLLLFESRVAKISAPELVLHPILEAALADVWLDMAGQWLMFPQEADKARADAWLMRAVRSVPKHPDITVWSMNADFRVGYRYTDEVLSASQIAWERARAAARRSDAREIAEACLRLDPEHSLWQERLAGVQ